MPNLGVNIDHVATLRQARGGCLIDPVMAALLCRKSGADSIVAHLREDRRHIQDRDVAKLSKIPGLNFNLEMSIAPAILKIACRLKPFQATLVPERRAELTTEGGLDVAGNLKTVSRAVAKLQQGGVRVSLFIDPVRRQIKAAKDSGAKIIELHTGNYALANSHRQKKKSFDRLRLACREAQDLNLTVNAGHGLDYGNVRPIAQIKGIFELNIGYSIICRSVFCGLPQAVREMKGLIG